VPPVPDRTQALPSQLVLRNSIPNAWLGQNDAGVFGVVFDLLAKLPDIDAEMPAKADMSGDGGNAH